jgi:hypothetical protein
MSRLHKISSSVLHASAVAVMIVEVLAPCAAQESGGCGEAVNGLQLCLTHKTSGQFRVELRNSGDHDLVLNIGVMLANGKRQYPTGIQLLLTDEKGSRAVTLKGPALLAGRVDPFVLALPVGAWFSFPVDLLRDCWSPETHEFEIKPKGKYIVRAQYAGKTVRQDETNLDMPALALMPYWTGTVQSAPFTSAD